jgi:putative peptidoglycan lipid II flippase
MSEHGRLLKSTSTISALTILSRIFGYFREQRVAFLLGTGDIADAYYVAYVIPNLLRRLVGEGAVSAAFIPTFSRYLSENRKNEAFQFANTLLTALTALLVVITILGIAFASNIIPLIAKGFDSPDKLEAAASLTRIMFPYLALVSLSALAMGVLNSFHKFAAPAFAPVLLNLSVIGFSFFAGFFSEPAVALAIGVVVGGVLQLLIQIPSLWNAGWTFRWLWDLSHPGVRRVAKLMGPLVFGVGIVNINVLVGIWFASDMSTGAIASIQFADRIMELVLGGYAIALATAILPLLSRQAAEQRMDEMRTSLNFAVRVILFVTLPATVGLILLRVPIIEVLFEHGEFNAESTRLTEWPLMFFSIGLSAFALMKIIVPAFYALHDTRTPVLIAFAAMMLNIALNFVFFDLLSNGAPPLATTVSAAFSTVVLIGIFWRRHGSLGVNSIVKSVSKFAVASVVMGVVCYAATWLPGFYAGSLFQRTLALAITILAAVGTYFGVAYLLRARELTEMGGVLSRRRAT